MLLILIGVVLGAGLGTLIGVRRRANKNKKDIAHLAALLAIMFGVFGAIIAVFLAP